MKPLFVLSACLSIFLAHTGTAQELCTGYGPQSPRNISQSTGTNPLSFPPAPPAEQMNLCNIHTHTNAEHKGRGFQFRSGLNPNGGYRCNATRTLSEEELAPLNPTEVTYERVAPGDTIEVHWVFTSCDVDPGPTLASCMSAQCKNPVLRVESQVFLVVNDENAIDFRDFAYKGSKVAGRHQPKALPSGNGPIVEYAGSTTGPDYNAQNCSPYQVSWAVRSECAKIDIRSLMAWGEDNIFEETHSHDVRRLVTEAELLSPLP